MEVVVPRGAIWLAEAFHFYSSLLKTVFDKLFPEVDIRIIQANRLRRVADQIRFTNPGVASDLYAAADRHIKNCFSE